MKCFLVFFIFLNVTCLPVWAEAFKVGTIYKDGPGEISALVEVSKKYFPQASDFRLLLDNQTVATAKKIDAFENSGRKMALVVCVDVSDSIGKVAFNELKAALYFLIGMAAERPTDRIALITFAHDVRIDSAFDKPRDQFLDAVMQLKPRGAYTRLYDALNQSLELLSLQDLPKRRRIIVISDGNDVGSTNTLENISLKAKTSGVPIDVAGFGKIDRTFRQILGGISDFGEGQLMEATFERNSLRDCVAGLYRDLLGGRSMMVYFSYEVDRSAEETENASIEMLQSGKNTVVADIPGKYALPKRVALATPENKIGLAPAIKPEFFPPPSSQNQSWLVRNWLLLCIFVLLVLAAILIFILRRPKITDADEDFEFQAVEMGDEPARDTVIDPVPKRVTLVGGYFFPLPEPGKPSAELVGIEGPLQETRHSINKELFSIGCAEGNDLCIPEDEYVAKQHAYLRYERGSLFIFDVGSKSGTFVNEKQVVGTGEVLEPGDHIKIGFAVFEVQKHQGEQD